VEGLAPVPAACQAATVEIGLRAPHQCGRRAPSRRYGPAAAPMWEARSVAATRATCGLCTTTGPRTSTSDRSARVPSRVGRGCHYPTPPRVAAAERDQPSPHRRTERGNRPALTHPPVLTGCAAAARLPQAYSADGASATRLISRQPTVSSDSHAGRCVMEWWRVGAMGVSASDGCSGCAKTQTPVGRHDPPPLPARLGHSTPVPQPVDSEIVKPGFPDCEAKRRVRGKAGMWQRVRIEFELQSRNFR
jgi:hypothetical protein